MITTIQLHEEVKKDLDRLKESKESYEEAVIRLIANYEKQKRQKSDALIEGYKEMAEESAKITKEWSSADKEWD